MVRLQKEGELEYLEVSNASALAKIALQGAHLFAFEAKEKAPLIWTSETSYFKIGKAIRGGIPICWPWFGTHTSDVSLPNHGFARTALWEHLRSDEIDCDTTRVVLALKSTPKSLEMWPYHFELELEITVSQSLGLALRTKNCDTKSFEITEALHTYFKVSNIEDVQINGLEAKHFYDKCNESHNNVQTEPLRFTQELDRVYYDVTTPLHVMENEKRINIKSKGAKSVVVWNPWRERAEQMSDLSDYKTMVCVESANVLENSCALAPQEMHTIKVHYTY